MQKFAKNVIGLATLLLAGTTVSAQSETFCVDRPGANTPPCVLAPGKVMAEVSAVDWTLDRAVDEREDTVLVGDALLRMGIGASTELRIGFTPYGHSRTRDRIDGTIEKDTGVGDVTLGVRHGFADYDGPAAVQLYVTLPTGGGEIGDGSWSAGMLLPIEFALSEAVSFAATPEVNAAANESGNGRHFAYGSAAGIALSLTDAVSSASEIVVLRDNDPAQASTQVSLSQSLAWQPDNQSQFDLQALVGLNGATPDLQFIAGVARSF